MTLLRGKAHWPMGSVPPEPSRTARRVRCRRPCGRANKPECVPGMDGQGDSLCPPSTSGPGHLRSPRTGSYRACPFAVNTCPRWAPVRGSIVVGWCGGALWVQVAPPGPLPHDPGSRAWRLAPSVQRGVTHEPAPASRNPLAGPSWCGDSRCEPGSPGGHRPAAAVSADNPPVAAFQSAATFRRRPAWCIRRAASLRLAPGQPDRLDPHGGPGAGEGDQANHPAGAPLNPTRPKRPAARVACGGSLRRRPQASGAGRLGVSHAPESCAWRLMGGRWRIRTRVRAEVRDRLTRGV